MLCWFPVLLRCKQWRRKERSPMQREDTSKVAIKKSASDEDRSAEEVDARSLRAQLSPVFFLTVIFSLNFVSRIILSPLLPTIEKELGVSHSQAGFFFFLSSGGYLIGLFHVAVDAQIGNRCFHRWHRRRDVGHRCRDQLVANALRADRCRFRRRAIPAFGNSHDHIIGRQTTLGQSDRGSRGCA